MRPEDKLPENLTFIEQQFLALTDRDGNPIVRIGHSGQREHPPRIRENKFLSWFFIPSLR